MARDSSAAQPGGRHCGCRCQPHVTHEPALQTACAAGACARPCHVRPQVKGRLQSHFTDTRPGARGSGAAGARPEADGGPAVAEHGVRVPEGRVEQVVPRCGARVPQAHPVAQHPEVVAVEVERVLLGRRAVGAGRPVVAACARPRRRLTTASGTLAAASQQVQALCQACPRGRYARAPRAVLWVAAEAGAGAGDRRKLPALHAPRTGLRAWQPRHRPASVVSARQSLHAGALRSHARTDPAPPAHGAWGLGGGGGWRARQRVRSAPLALAAMFWMTTSMTSPSRATTYCCPATGRGCPAASPARYTIGCARPHPHVRPHGATARPHTRITHSICLGHQRAALRAATSSRSRSSSFSSSSSQLWLFPLASGAGQWCGRACTQRASSGRGARLQRAARLHHVVVLVRPGRQRRAMLQEAVLCLDLRAPAATRSARQVQARREDASVSVKGRRRRNHPPYCSLCGTACEQARHGLDDLHV